MSVRDIASDSTRDSSSSSSYFNAKSKTKSKTNNNKKGRLTRSSSASSSSSHDERGVVYIGHLPFGFFENELYTFFSQFGKIRRLRVMRSEKTGKSKGYAFIEFELEEIAKIVAETMNGYMMYNKTLVCEFKERNNMIKNLLKGKGCRGDLSTVLTHKQNVRKAIQRHNKNYSYNDTPENSENNNNSQNNNVNFANIISPQLHKRILREIRKRNKISKLNLDFDWEGNEQKNDGKNNEKKEEKLTKINDSKTPSKQKKQNSNKESDTLHDVKIKSLVQKLKKVKKVINKKKKEKKNVVHVRRGSILNGKSIIMKKIEKGSITKNKRESDGKIKNDKRKITAQMKGLKKTESNQK